MAKRKLPTGVQTFREVRGDDCYYVDKTRYLALLAAEGKHYLLSRPRRFGKSLFLDTARELFEGNERLFRGLAVHGAWDWAVRHPVITLSFAAGHFDQPGLLRDDLADKFARLERIAGAQAEYATVQGRFAGLIEALFTRAGQRVVVLVDEYDRPIVDALDDAELAKRNRSILRGLYGVVKDCDRMIRMSFFTGVSKFSKVSLFSDLNNLTDITLDPRFAAVCGYTDRELETTFAPELEGLDRAAIRDWYDGYNWRGGEDERVYNPYGMLLFLASREFRSYWFETGTPAFLPNALMRRRVDPASLEDLAVGDADLADFDIHRMKPEALLFQTGYLTILGEERRPAGLEFRLGYPNREVRGALNLALLSAMAPEVSAQTECSRLERLVEAQDFAGLERLFRAFFASVPHEWYAANDIARFEGYYSAVFYSHFVGAGLDVVAEESTSRGRADIVVRHERAVWVFELKSGGAAQDALAQIDARGYADKYRHLGLPIHCIGVSFRDRNIAAFKVESAD